MWRWSATCRERDFRPDRDVLPLHEGFASFQTGETPKKRNKKLPSKIGDGNRQIKSNKISLYSLLKELHERSAIIDMSTYITPEILVCMTIPVFDDLLTFRSANVGRNSPSIQAILMTVSYTRSIISRKKIMSESYTASNAKRSYSTTKRETQYGQRREVA